MGISETHDPIASVVFEHSPDAIFIESLDGTIIEVNPEACRLHGVCREDLVGSSVFDLVPPEEREVVREKFPLVARGAIDRFEGYSWRADGSRVPVEIQANRIAYLGEPALLLIVRDITVRVDTADRLRRERDVLRGVIDANPLAVFVLDADGTIAFASEQAEQLLRLEPDDMVGKPYCDPTFGNLAIDGSPIADADLPAYAVIAEGREVRDFRHLIGWPDGEARRICVNGSPLRDDNGALTGGVFVVEDVTESDRMVDDLRVSQERLTLAMDAAKMGMWDWDVETGDVVFNEAWPRLLGYQLDEIEQSYETWANSVHPDDRAAAVEELDRHVRGETDVYRGEFRMKHRDGRWVWCGAIGHVVDRDTDGNARRVIGLDYDIDASKRSELALRASEHRYRELVNSIDPIVWEIALPDWRYTFVSPEQAQRVLGYPVDLWYASIDNWVGWIVPEDREWVMEHCRDRTSNCEDHEMQYRMTAADGSIVWIRDIVKVVTDDNGQPVGLRGVIIDVTESRRQSERLRILLNELDHRVRNNLTSLVSLIDLYQSGGRDAEGLADALRIQIGAMASAHSHIADAHGEPVRLDRLVGSLTGGMPRLVVDGPDCAIDPARVAAITIMIQEWITNSHKHGALGSPDGVARFTWERDSLQNGDDGLVLRWAESDGPPVQQRPLGVGLTLIKGFVEHELHGTCDFDFAHEGFGCMVRLPRIVSETGTSAAAGA